MFPAEAVPDRIGAYKVVRRLSRTGSADVYLGRMEGPMGFRRLCELKLVASELESDAGLAEELAREAAICSRLNHPAILRMFDFFEFERRLVLVVEHLDGTDLERLLQHLARRKQKLGDEATWYIAHQLVGALGHAHSATDEDGNSTPVVHRNLSPDNVLVGWDAQVRLAGFGLGKILGRSPDSVVGVIKGKPGYMAPEQARGERVTPRADVYGIGLLMWCLLTGRVPPLHGMRPEALSSVRPDLPKEIAAAIEAALEPSPDKRKITCTEIEHWLKKITKIEAGRDELQEKIILLRATRSPVAEGAVEPPHTVRPPAKVTAQRRRLSIRGLHAQQTPGAPFARSMPPSSSRPPPRGIASTMPPAGGSEPPPSSRSGGVSMRRYPTTEDIQAFDRRPTSRSIAALLGDDLEGPGSFAPPPITAPDSVAPRGLASQPPPPMSMPLSQTMPVMAPLPVVPPPVFASGGFSEAAPFSSADTNGVAPLANGAASLRDPNATEALAAASPSPPFASVASFEPAPRNFRPPEASIDDERGYARGGRRSRLSAVQSIGVAAITAAVIVGIGVFVAETRGNRNVAQPQPPSVVFIPMPSSNAPAAERPAPTATATASTDGSSLPGGYGYVLAASPAPGIVFVNGHRMGQTNEQLQAQCGTRFVRIGTFTESGNGPYWIAPGQTINIPCQGSVRVEFKPSPSGK